MTEKNDSSEEVKRIRVWDGLIRTLHWCLVVSFCTGYIITDQFPIHAYSGYVIFIIVIVRIVWGFVGSEYARFNAFRYGWDETIRYTLSALKMGEAREYLSHNPMGAIMVYVLLLMMLMMTIVGIMLYAAQQLEGPLESIVPVDWEDPLLLAHQVLAGILLALAIIHVLGVLWATWWHRQNYILAMFTGIKSAHTRRAKRRGEGGVWDRQQRKQMIKRKETKGDESI